MEASILDRTVVSGTIALNPGQKYDIKFEYFENAAGAKAKVEWASSFQEREVVPKSQFSKTTCFNPS